MSNVTVPLQKIGTPFQRPAWRFQALLDPDRFGFRALCSRPVDNAGFLGRLHSKGIAPVVTYSYPAFFEQVASQLPAHLARTLQSVWDRRFRQTHKRKATYESLANFTNFFSWHARKIEGLNDLWFKRLVKHTFNLAYDPDVEFALRMDQDPQFAQNRRFIGYAVFAGLSDAEVAKQWNISPRKVEAMRWLFFDFSYFPKEKTSQWALLKQLGDSKDIRPEDFVLYRKILEMDGFNGVRAFTTPYHLKEDQRAAVLGYLNQSALANTLALNYTVKTKTDALTYNRVMHDTAMIALRKEEVRAKQHEIEYMQLQSAKLRREVEGMSEGPGTNEQDADMLKATIKRLSRLDPEPKFPNISDLRQVV